MEYKKTQQPIGRQPRMKWVLLLILGLSIAIGFGLTDSSDATAYGLANLTTSSPISPVPTPADVLLKSVDPDQGVNSVVVYVNIYGENLREGGQLYLRYASNQDPIAGETERAMIPIYSRVINSTKIVGRIPAKVDGYPLKPGYYDFVLAYQEAKTVLEKAYRVFDPEDVNDLYAEPYHLDSEPNQLWVGEETQLTLRVQRFGGQGGTGPFDVDFYLNSIEPENRIGRATVPGISPNDSASSSIVTWTPSTYGKVKIIAVIDAEYVVAETDEDNNVVVIYRRVSVAQTQDTYPPVVSNLQVNGGVKEVSQQQVELSATITDDVDPENPNAVVSGPNRIYYVELHWYSGIGGHGSWIPVNWTSWLTYEDAPKFELHPTPGLRYLQAWGADAAGNISNLPDGRRLNYIPAEDEVVAGEIRVYRQETAAGSASTYS
ncbi:MAG: CARDB domain-containing protein [Caldilineaceae bacterium]